MDEPQQPSLGVESIEIIEARHRKNGFRSHSSALVCLEEPVEMLGIRVFMLAVLTYRAQAWLTVFIKNAGIRAGRPHQAGQSRTFSGRTPRHLTRKEAEHR